MRDYNESYRLELYLSLLAQSITESPYKWIEQERLNGIGEKFADISRQRRYNIHFDISREQSYQLRKTKEYLWQDIHTGQV